MKAPLDPLLTPAQAAARLHVGKATIAKYIKNGVLPAYKVPGSRVVRIESSAVNALIVPIEPGKAAE